MTDASFDAWQGRTKRGPFRDVSRKGPRVCRQVFSGFFGAPGADKDALCSGRRGNDGEPHPSASPPRQESWDTPSACGGHPMTSPRRGRLHGLPPAFLRDVVFRPTQRTPRTSLVSLPRLGAWSARKTVRWTVFSGRRAAAPDGGSERQRGDG